MATHSSVLAWRILWTEEPGGLQSTGLKSWTRLSERARTHTHTHTHTHLPPYKQENRTSLKLVLLKGLNKITCAVLA